MSGRPSKNFDYAIQLVLKHEGGYVNDPHDPGGETKYGISKRSYPKVDIANLTVDQAKAIYKRDFWDPHFFDDIEDQKIATKIFDFTVNMGASRAIRIAQNALQSIGKKVTVDGRMGPGTIRAINESDSAALLKAIQDGAAAFYRSLVTKNKKLGKFLKGWLRRAYA